MAISRELCKWFYDHIGCNFYDLKVKRRFLPLGGEKKVSRKLIATIDLGTGEKIIFLGAIRSFDCFHKLIITLKRQSILKSFKAYIILVALLLTGPGNLFAGWELDLESGGVFSGYNDVQIPRETGTKISLVDDLSTDSKVFFRARLTWNINDKHSLSLLAAPLKLNANGQVDKEVFFEGTTFPANTPLDALYRFDSYRLTYRYNLHRKENLTIGVGFTAKIRDAEVSLESSELKSSKANTGFVPLINFRLNWLFAPRFSLLFEGDALAAPQGRVEDVFLGLTYDPIENLGLKIGYRVLEGGADVEEVYNFTLLHYISLGAIIRF